MRVRDDRARADTSSMRTLDDGTLALSPSDLSAHLACPHLTTLSLAVARGELEQPHLDSPHRDLIFRKGNEHEQAYLAGSRRSGRSIVRIPTLDDEDFDPAEAATAHGGGDPRGRGGRDLPAVPHGRPLAGLRGLPRAQPGGGYEPVDTKLARSAKPSARPPALLLRRAGRADPGRAGRARPRRERPRRAGDVPGRGVRVVLPPRARALPRRARRGAGDVPVAVRPLRDLRLPPALLPRSGSTTTT